MHNGQILTQPLFCAICSIYTGRYRLLALAPMPARFSVNMKAHQP